MQKAYWDFEIWCDGSFQYEWYFVLDEKVIELLRPQINVFEIDISYK